MKIKIIISKTNSSTHHSAKVDEFLEDVKVIKVENMIIQGMQLSQGYALPHITTVITYDNKIPKPTPTPTGGRQVDRLY